jgi:hypothetical protein
MIMFKIGDTCFFLESNIHVIEGTIRSCVGGKYIVRYGSGKGIRLTEKRLYRTLEEAEAAIPRRAEARRKSPYDYM